MEAAARDDSGAGLQGSRERILDAALELMAEKGYAGMSMSMLNKRSGLTSSSTYWHFRNKADLLAAVVEYSAGRWLADLPRWDELEGSPTDCLHQVLTSAQSASGESFLRLLMLLALEAPAGDEWLETIRRVRHSAAGGFRKAYNEIVGVPTDQESRRTRDEFAEFALAVTDGVFLATQIDEDVDVARMFALLERSFVALCRGESARRRD